MDQIFEIGKSQSKTKPNKNCDFKMGVFHKQGPPKFKFFNLFSWTHEIFKVSKYKR